MFYSQQDVDQLSALLKRFYRNMALIWIVPALMVAASLIWRIAPLGYAGAVILALTGALGWYAVGLRIFRYRRLVRDILENKERGAEGEIVSTEGAPVTRDGSTFTPIELKVVDDERADGYVRNIFFDTLKGEVPVRVGHKVKVTLFDNIIKSIEILED